MSEEKIHEDTAAHKRKDFVLRNVSTKILRSLSPQARGLWLVLRRLADAKTGVLRYPSGQLVPRQKIMAEAHMFGKNTLSKYLSELRNAGLAHVRQLPVTVTRPDGSKHNTFSLPEYAVSDSPRQDWVSCVSLSKKPHRHNGPCVSLSNENGLGVPNIASTQKQGHKESVNHHSEGSAVGVGVGSDVAVGVDPKTHKTPKRKSFFSERYEPTVQTLICLGRARYLKQESRRHDPRTLVELQTDFRRLAATCIDWKEADPLWRNEVKDYCDLSIARRNEAHMLHVIRWRRRHADFTADTWNAYVQLIAKFPLFAGVRLDTSMNV